MGTPRAETGGRKLFVYWKLRPADEAAVLEELRRALHLLGQTAPGLRCELMCRECEHSDDGSVDPPSHREWRTWMECYEHADGGISRELEAMIASAHAPWASRCAIHRHTEVFVVPA